MQETNVLIQYQNVFIPLGVSVLTGIITFFVYKEKVNNLENDNKEVKKELKEIRDKVIKCETALDYKEPLTKRKSPVSLTDRGMKVLQESGGKDLVDNNYSELKSKVDSKEPKTSYDIQEASKTVITEFTNDERINPIKEYLFKEGMEITEIIEVLGIYLRDKVLEEKGINKEDIDNYDPIKKQL